MECDLSAIAQLAHELAEAILALPEDARIEAVNMARKAIHEASPMRHEPVDLVLWVPVETVGSNDYNPNTVAPPEMRLLERSISADGYTMPVVTWLDDSGNRETVDGFHRGKVCRVSDAVRARTHGYLPVSTINGDRADRGDRMAATVRHNRARGQHGVGAMSDIVMDLIRRRWSDERIANELGMDADEVIRLKQITGLAEMFADREFSEAWSVSDV